MSTTPTFAELYPELSVVLLITITYVWMKMLKDIAHFLWGRKEGS